MNFIYFKFNSNFLIFYNPKFLWNSEQKVYEFYKNSYRPQKNLKFLCDTFIFLVVKYLISKSFQCLNNSQTALLSVNFCAKTKKNVWRIFKLVT